MNPTPTSEVKSSFPIHANKHDNPTFPCDVPLDLIAPNPFQPRRKFDEQAMQELTDSIQKHGVLQPILLRQVETGCYEIVAGERRYHAAIRLGFRTIPALVRKFEAWEQMELALVENLQREDLNPVETARAFYRLMDVFGMTQKEIAKRVNKDFSTISNSLRLLNLPEAILESLHKGEIQEGHAKVLLRIEDEALQTELWQKVVADHLTVRQTEKLIAQPRNTQSKDDAEPKQAALPALSTAAEPTRQEDHRTLPAGTPESRMQEILMQTFERRVMIRHSYAQGGTIEIGFHDSGDLLNVVNRLLNVAV